jgi:hypothetical protein
MKITEMTKTDRTPMFLNAMKEAMAEHGIVDKVVHVLVMIGMMLLLILPAKIRAIFGKSMPPNSHVLQVAENVWQLSYEVLNKN